MAAHSFDRRMQPEQPPGTPQTEPSDIDMEQDVSDASIDPAQMEGFVVMHEKMLERPTRPGLTAWSPRLDLFATVTTQQNVFLSRMNGQRVWWIQKIPEDSNGVPLTIERLQWRPDGRMLALGYTDGKTRIYDVNNGRKMHEIASEHPEFGRVTCLSWADNHSHIQSPATAPADQKSDECTPETLHELDITSMLPPLGVISPSVGQTGDPTFNNPAALKALINSSAISDEGKKLDILLMGDENGKIFLSMFDSFKLGTLELSKLSSQLKPGSHLIQHVTSMDLLTHSLIISGPQSNSLYFSTLDVLFIEQFAQYLFQLASTSTRVEALTRYLLETVATIEADFKALFDFSMRYVRILEEDALKINSTVELELFEYLATGAPSPILKEWLKDCVGDMGQKKWMKSSLEGYEKMRRMMHQNLLPTCERLTVLFSRLRGLARWKESGSPLGLEPDDFTRCLEVVSAMTLYAHEFLQKLSKELDLYKSFNAWLKYSVYHLLTVVNIEDKATDPQIDTLKVAEYLGANLMHSCLHPYMARNSHPQLNEYSQRGENILDLYSKKERTPNTPGFMELAEYLAQLCKDVFSKPQQSMREQLRISKPVLISKGKLDKYEMRMVMKKPSRVEGNLWNELADDRKHIGLFGDNTWILGEACAAPYKKKAPVSTYMLLYKEDEENDKFVTIVRYQIDIEGGLSTASTIGCAKVALPECILVDSKFVDDQLVIMILHDKETKSSELVTMAYRELDFDEKYRTLKSSMSVYDYAQSLEAQSMPIVRRRTTFDRYWVPTEVAVNGDADRRVGCVIASDGVRCKIFDIDCVEEPHENEQQGEQEDEEENAGYGYEETEEEEGYEDDEEDEEGDSYDYDNSMELDE